MMKRIFLLTLAAALLLSLTALAAPERTILIYTRYQSDWTHEMQLGGVDAIAHGCRKPGKPVCKGAFGYKRADSGRSRIPAAVAERGVRRGA